jgi:putative ABC transport system permease protein
VTAAPVLTAASGGLTRRLVQTLVIFIVLAAAAASATLGLSLLTNANEAFTSSFAAHHGADVAVTVDTSRVTAAQLAATRHVTGVTQAAGPYPQLTITFQASAPSGPPPGAHGGPGGPAAGTVTGTGQSQTTVVGRAAQDGPLDDLAVQQGHWLSGLGQVFMANYLDSSGPVGSKLIVVSAPSKPKLTIVAVGACDEFRAAPASDDATPRVG